jgi:hypothetical protein
MTLIKVFRNTGCYKECVPIVRDKRFRKNSDYLLKHILGFVFCKP